MLGYLILFAIIAGVYYLITKPFNYWSLRGVKQGKPVPILGDNWKTLFRLWPVSEFVQYAYNLGTGARYSGVYQLYTPILVLRDPELIKQITVKDFDYFTDRFSFISEEADPIWGKQLLSLTGKRWRDMRATLSPSFTSSKMRYMFVLISESAENFINYFNKKKDDIVEIEMKDIFTRFTSDVIATTAFGIQIDSLVEKDNDFYLLGKELTNFKGIWKNIRVLGFFFIPKIYKYFKVTLLGQKTNDFFVDIVTNTINTREEKNIVRNDMINLLMEAKKGNSKIEESTETLDTGFATVEESDIGKEKVKTQISDMDIAAQAMIFFFAGFDSVSSLMCFMTYELAVHSDIQKRLREEIKDTLKECGGTLTYEGLLKMKYMDMVVSETLRKWPNAVLVDRICTKPYTIEPTYPGEQPINLKKGDILWLPIFALHRDPDNFPDPDKFDPERYNDNNKGNIKPYTYLPFGSGPRNCIGSRFALLEAKTIFFHILNNFELVPTKKSIIPLQLSKSHFSVTSEGGFWFGLTRIENKP